MLPGTSKRPLLFAAVLLGMLAFLGIALKNDVLMVSAGKGRVLATRLFLRLGANPNSQDDEGVTALAFAVQEKQNKTARILLEHGADPNRASQIGMTPLMHAADHGSMELVAQLLSHGARVGARNQTGATPCLFAIANKHQDVLRTLLRAAVERTGLEDINADQGRGRSLLLFSIFLGDAEIAEALLKRGAQPNIQTDGGGTPLMYAARFNQVEIVKALLSSKANINAVDHEGMTALMYAAKFGHLESARVLLENGASIASKDPDFSALNFALKKGDAEMIRLLQQASSHRK